MNEDTTVAGEVTAQTPAITPDKGEIIGRMSVEELMAKAKGKLHVIPAKNVPLGFRWQCGNMSGPVGHSFDPKESNLPLEMLIMSDGKMILSQIHSILTIG